MTLGMVPGTEPAARFVAALQAGQAAEARRIAVEEAPAYELTRFIVEPLILKLDSLPRHFMAGQEASRTLARMLVKDLVDQMFAGDISTGGHQGLDGRWYVYKGLSPNLVEVSPNIIEKVDKVRYVAWLEPLEALLVQHLSGRMDRESFFAAARSPEVVHAATYPHRALQRAATARPAPSVDAGTGPLSRHAPPWDPKQDPDLRVCFSGEHGYIVMGGGQSPVIDQAYREAIRLVRRMSHRELLDVARRVLGEMLQPDYPNFIRNVTAKVTPILGLPPEKRFEIQEDMAAGGRDNVLLMLALSRARHAGWLSDGVVEELYALRANNAGAEGTAAVQGTEAYNEMVARLMDRPDDRGFLESLGAAEARILLDDATQLLQHQRAQSVLATPADRMRRGLALLKILTLQGVLDGFMIHPYAGRNFFPAQFGRMAALNEQASVPETKTDWQLFIDEVAREEEVCARAGVQTDRIRANLVAQRVPGLVALASTMAARALGGAVRAIPDKPVTVLLHLREWVRCDPAGPPWAWEVDLAHTRLVDPWASVLRPGDYLVLMATDSAFSGRLLSRGDFEEVDLGVAPEDRDRPSDTVRLEPERGGTRPLSSFDLPIHAVVLRKIAPESSVESESAP